MTPSGIISILFPTCCCMNLAISGTERSPIYVTAVLLCDENSITVGKALMFRLGSGSLSEQSKS
eukprot:CAMPEP_0173112584 /NCGR_PEP_ID=MMETSP1102-20130122/46156_1 /TAXON_ID=49646 /ORGANISM="Geminigera sp., Strain Caron Lab Isolate" /LENGTH=63 /DNA_ID=CAMNT_0014013785 /DNA_START=79 /DNA_END=270 /DNA_ORIENTATION=+